VNGAVAGFAGLARVALSMPVRGRDLARLAAPEGDLVEYVEHVIDLIGNTPLVRLGTLSEGLAPLVLAKVEYFNPGGSVKDRIALRMVEAAERSGALRPGGTIVEPTSGNTGVGLAIVAQRKGYQCVFVCPDKVSEDKRNTLKAYGAEVVVCPTAVPPEHPDSYYNVSDRLVGAIDGAWKPDQYSNEENPASHYHSTGPELWRQTGGRIRAFIAGMGTGGTISGTGRFLKEQNPTVTIVGVDPVGSLLHHYFHTRELGPAHGYKVEGVGEDFLPSTLDFDVIDDVVQVSDREAFTTTRRLVREEGLFGGGSCGLAVAGALKWLRGNGAALSEDDMVVVLLPDSGSRYLSKVFDDNWMRENGFLEQASVADLLASRPREVITVGERTSVEAAIRQMKIHGISQLPVLDDAGQLHGIIGESDLLDYLLSGGAMDHTIADLHAHEVATIDPQMPIEELTAIFGRSQAAVVVEAGAVVGIVTKIDVIDFLASRNR